MPEGSGVYVASDTVTKHVSLDNSTNKFIWGINGNQADISLALADYNLKSDFPVFDLN